MAGISSIRRIQTKNMQSFNPHVARFYLANGSKPPTPKCAALSYFAMKDRADLIRVAVRRGADIHINDDEPFRIACEFGSLDAIRYLLRHGANIHAMNDYAMRNARNDQVRYILNHSNDFMY